jgi:ABC-type transport system involved in multi-copper enzyme maturation permease subunit
MTATSPAPAETAAVTRVQRRHVSDLEQWWIATLHQLGHYVRTNRFFGLLGLVTAVSALTLGFQVDAGVAAVQFQQLYRASEYLSNFLMYTGLWVVLAAALFGGDALSVDFSTGTGYYMLVLPIRRPVLLAGRYVAASLVTLAVVGVSYAFAAGGAVYFFGIHDVPWLLLLESYGIAAMFGLAALSVAFCVSAYVRSPAAGVLFTLIALYVGFTTLQAVVEFAGYEPWFSLTYAGGAMAAVLDTDFIHVQAIPVGEDQVYYLWASTVQEGLAIMAAYIAVFLPFSAYLYQRKESTG